VGESALEKRIFRGRAVRDFGAEIASFADPSTLMKGTKMIQQADEFRAYAVHLAAEHRRIADFLCHIEKNLRWADSAIESVRLKEDLRKLRTELVAHFNEEESGGCLEEAVVHLPSLAADAARVLCEHTQFIADIDRMIERLETAEQRTPEQVKIDFRDFTKRLHAHEASENRILQASFGVEVP
jgi:hypothetical protein